MSRVLHFIITRFAKVAKAVGSVNTVGALLIILVYLLGTVAVLALYCLTPFLWSVAWDWSVAPRLHWPSLTFLHCLGMFILLDICQRVLARNKGASK